MNSYNHFEIIVAELYRSAADIKKTISASGALIDLPKIIIPLAWAIAHKRYKPDRYTLFVVTDPKPREYLRHPSLTVFVTTGLYDSSSLGGINAL